MEQVVKLSYMEVKKGIKIPEEKKDENVTCKSASYNLLYLKWRKVGVLMCFVMSMYSRRLKREKCCVWIEEKRSFFFASFLEKEFKIYEKLWWVRHKVITFKNLYDFFVLLILIKYFHQGSLAVGALNKSVEREYNWGLSLSCKSY